MRHPILPKVLPDIELRNYSEATKDLCLRTCARYLEFLGDKPVESTGESDVRAFSRHLRCDCGLAPKTVNTYLAAVIFMCVLSSTFSMWGCGGKLGPLILRY